MIKESASDIETLLCIPLFKSVHLLVHISARTGKESCYNDDLAVDDGIAVADTTELDADMFVVFSAKPYCAQKLR